jgi:CubicO group peptidase (beta-lactamase class C family)
MEVITGQPLDELLVELVLGPLGMDDTTWWVDQPHLDRLATLYALVSDKLVPYPPLGEVALSKPPVLNGGGGLVSSAADYWQFCRMLQHGGELEGTRIIALRTLEMMATNHLPGGKDLAGVNSGGFSETIFDGIGFGLGFATVLDPAPGKTAASKGEIYWGGLASTAFWVDRSTGVSAAFYTQLMPSSTYPIRSQLRQLVYAALTD